MNAISKLSESNMQATEVGLKISGEITFEQWAQVAENFGHALQSAAWCIGDWLVYGESKWSGQKEFEGFPSGSKNRVPADVYDQALAATGLDRNTLQSYATVCRAIPIEERKPNISFAHHRQLYPLPPAERLAWLQLLENKKGEQIPSVRLLKASMKQAPQGEPVIYSPDEIITHKKAAAHENHLPHLTRLITVIKRNLPGMDEYQKEMLKEDLKPLAEIIIEL